MTVTVPAPDSPYPNTAATVNGGLFWREDEALKNYLLNAHLVTYDQTAPAGGRAVMVYFRFPQNELRIRQYPMLIIDRLPFTRDPEREMRGRFYLSAADPYVPDGTTPGDGQDYYASQLPIPISIPYQLSVYTRERRQMLWIENRMATVLPLRFGALPMIDSVHARDDDTVRRLDVTEGPIVNDQPDPENAHKRIFGRVWTVEISSEILPSDLEALGGTGKVQRVVIDPSNRPGYDSVTE